VTEEAWAVLPVEPDVGVTVTREMPRLDDAVEARTEAIWRDEREERPGLFNGRVFTADEITPRLITGHWTEYRRVMAQMRDPSLFATLKLRSLAVNGLLECPGGIVLGRRAADSVYLAGRWQAAPAGTVEARSGDAIDLVSQLDAELREEVGLEPHERERPRAVLAMEHAGTHIVDIGFLLRTSLDFETIRRRQEMVANDEYDMLRLVTREDAPSVLARAGDTLVPTARMLIERWLERVSVR